MIICFAGQKGGAGKTTTALNLGYGWHAEGKHVLMVDADPQGSLMTWSQLASEHQASIPTVIAMGEGLHRPEQLPRLAPHYDHVLIDCPPRHGRLQRAALMVSDLALLPCGPSAVDAWALAETLEMVEEARLLRPQLQAVLLLTRQTAHTTLGRSAREVLETSGLPVLQTELGYRVAYQEAPAAGLGVTAYEPGGKAAREILCLLHELSTLMRIPQEVNHVA
jgi:chromosome partitioning protein